MPHHVLGLGWGEIVSIVTLIIVIANYFKSTVSSAAHESNRHDMEDLNNKLINFKINVSELNQLLKQVNKDLGALSKRVDDHDKAIDQLKLDVAKLKEHLGVK